MYSDVNTVNHSVLKVNLIRVTPTLRSPNKPFALSAEWFTVLFTNTTHFTEFPLTFRSTIFYLKTHYTISYMRLVLSLHDSALLHETSVYNIHSIMVHLQLDIKIN
jgi:hypothetical protein